MFHQIQPTAHGALGPPMANAVQSCVHCGFCLAACPTYRELGQEMDTPRGRIVLMKQVLEGTLPLEAALPHVDRCLGCLACEPACPSGVAYRDLLSPFRALAEPKRKRSLLDRIRRKMIASTLPYPRRFRTAILAGRLGKIFAGLVPKSLRPMFDLIPRSVPAEQSWPEVNPAHGQRRARVALLIGCAQQVIEPDINTATIDVLTRNGVEVIVPPRQGCCGALAWHVGDLPSAQKLARQNLRAFPSDVDAIVTNAAGCGSGMHEYHLILAGSSEAEAADQFRHRVIDVSAFLQRLGLAAPIPGLPKPIRIAYQDACHLANAQGVRAEPRALLRAIPNGQVVELANAHLCCGSAGTYNLDQPEIAAHLGADKARAILDSGCDVVATGNIGCMTQLRLHLDGRKPVLHTMQILRNAYHGTLA
jgi:glycolate oxidase iron-sulfur subunit